MSLETREWVADCFGQIDSSQRDDLLNPALTTTDLIAFLQELFMARNGIWVGRLECTAVRSDHPTQDGPNGHSGGNAIDFIEIDEDASEHLIKDVQACEGAKGIGLGGEYQKYAQACGGYNEASKLFQDNQYGHIHIQVQGY